MEPMKLGRNTTLRQWTREEFTTCWTVRGATSVLRFSLDDPIGVVGTVVGSSGGIANPATLDTCRGLLEHRSHLKGPVMGKMLDFISSELATKVDADMR